MALVNKATIARMIRANALRKGLLGGSPFWRAVWLFQLARKGWSRISKKGEAPITFTEPLKEGEAWALVHVPEQSARGRGEGRRYVVGPKRKAPRATALAGPALTAIGAKILEAPSAERVNQILGEDVVSDPAPSRRQRKTQKRIAKADAKADAKANAAAAQAAKRQAKRDADDAARIAKHEAKAAKQDAKAAAKAAKQDAKAAAESRKVAEREAKRAARQAEREVRAAKRAAAREAKKAVVEAESS